MYGDGELASWKFAEPDGREAGLYMAENSDGF